MNNANFVKGVGVGLVVGSAIGLAVYSPNRNFKRTAVGRALKTVGEIVENIGDSMR